MVAYRECQQLRVDVGLEQAPPQRTVHLVTAAPAQTYTEFTSDTECKSVPMQWQAAYHAADHSRQLLARTVGHC